MVALACSDPADHGLPICRWTIRTLGKAATRLGHVKTIAAETVYRWLPIADLKLHRYRHWLHSTDPQFDQKMADIVQLYVNPPADAAVYCIDERTGMQALERICPGWPTRPGLIRRREFHYRRHGTLTLFGCLEVATGKSIGRCYRRHRSHEFVDFLRQLLPSLPQDRKLHFVLDNYATHKTAQVKQLLARQDGRGQFHFTPTHASWLNQIELWFATLTRQVLSLGSFCGLDDLTEKVRNFIDYYNREEARPYRWTYTGPPRAV